jgi:hypothetical protein
MDAYLGAGSLVKCRFYTNANGGESITVSSSAARFSGFRVF